MCFESVWRNSALSRSSSTMRKAYNFSRLLTSFWTNANTFLQSMWHENEWYIKILVQSTRIHILYRIQTSDDSGLPGILDFKTEYTNLWTYSQHFNVVYKKSTLVESSVEILKFHACNTYIPYCDPQTPGLPYCDPQLTTSVTFKPAENTDTPYWITYTCRYHVTLINWYK